MALSNDTAALLGFACEAIFWGVYVVLFLASTSLLLRRPRSMNGPIFAANCALFASCTAHFFIEFVHYYTTLTTIGVQGYANETTSLLAADLLISFSDLLGGLVLLYRCWIIWGKWYLVVIPPLLSALGGFACILVVVYYVATADPTSPTPPPAIVPLGLAGYILPLATNAAATGLIVARLLVTARRVKRYGDDEHGKAATTARRAVAIIVESGALYLATQLAFVVLFALDHPAQAIVAVIAVQIYGIAPTLMVMQVALGFSTSDRHGRPRSGSGLSTSASVHFGGASRGSGGGGGMGASTTHLAVSEPALVLCGRLPRAAFMSGVSAVTVAQTVDSGHTLADIAGAGVGDDSGYFGEKYLDLERFEEGLGMAL